MGITAIKRRWYIKEKRSSEDRFEVGAEEWSTGLRCGGKRKEKSDQEDEGRAGVLICLQSRRKDVEAPARRRGACNNGNGQMDGMGWMGMDGIGWM